MLSDVEEVSRLALQIRSLLASSQYLELKDLMRWIIANPILRTHQLSLAFLHLNEELKWDLVDEFGPTSFKQFDGISDLQICNIRESSPQLPLGFLAWPQADPAPEEEVEELYLFALPLGNRDYDDGILICHSISGYPNSNRPEPFSFLRLAAEFIYRHHKLAISIGLGKSLQAESRQVSDSDSDEPNPLDGVSLTERQLQILDHIAAGLTNDEIAKNMHVSLGTVRVETSRIYDRLGARNRHQAASLAHLLLSK